METTTQLASDSSSESYTSYALRVLKHLSEQLAAAPPRLTAESSDGRVNSSKNEEEVLTHLRVVARTNETFSKAEGLVLHEPPAREWFDFVVKRARDDLFIPVNIKVTDAAGPDNVNCKLGLYYALSGCFPTFKNSISWVDYLEHLHARLVEPTTDKDYFFLVVNKSNPGDVFATSLRQLSAVNPNAQNLPFQCNWSRNRTPQPRTYDEAKQFLLGTFWQSLARREPAVQKFRELFPEIVEGQK